MVFGPAWCDICSDVLAVHDERDKDYDWLRNIRYLYAYKCDPSDDNKDGSDSFDVRLSDTKGHDELQQSHLRIQKPTARAVRDFGRGQPNDIWVVPFHSVCWDILQQYYGDCPLPLDRIFKIFLSASRLQASLIPSEVFNPTSNEFRLAKLNNSDGLRYGPRDTTWITELLAKSKSSNNGGSVVSSISYKKSSHDLFSALPRDVLIMIVDALPTKSFMALRLASRTVAADGFPHSFWLSRFAEDHEFEHFGYLMPRFRASARQLYQTLRACSSPGPLVGARYTLQMERVLSKTLKELKNLLSRESTICHGDIVYKDADTWFTPGLQLYPICDHEGLEKLPRRLQTRQVRVPKRFREISVSFLKTDGKYHVSGLRFLDGSSQYSIGHTGLREQSLAVPLEKKFLGLELALHPDGIAAVALAYKDGTISRWIGDPNGSVHLRLVSSHLTVLNLGADFNALKMLSLCIPYSRLPASIRYNVVWWPKVPDSHQIVPCSTYSPGYEEHRIYNLVLFGGHHGELLSKLIKIRLRSHDNAGTTLFLPRLEFVYQDHQKTWRKSCIQGPFNTFSLGDQELEDASSSTIYRSEVLIDGPHGERISCAATSTHGRTVDLRIHTTFGRVIELTEDYGEKTWSDIAYCGGEIIGFLGWIDSSYECARERGQLTGLVSMHGSGQVE